MKYKVGDRIKIKEENSFINECRDLLESVNPPYVLTIIEACDKYDRNDGYCGERYKVKENGQWNWYTDNIEGLYKEEVFDPIESRLDILDL